jgi:membrane protease YdiL (CAAX protease family)
MGLLVPFLEEIIFRGVVFDRLRKTTKLPVALVLQALIFGISHLNVLQGTYTFVFGIAVGLIYLWSGSIWAAVAVHIAYNLTSVIFSYLLGDAEVRVSGLVVIALVGIAIAVAGMVVCRRGKVFDTKGENDIANMLR